jgi:hypothetical protein
MEFKKAAVNVSLRVQVSERYRGQSTENRRQKTKGRMFSVFCHLTSVICYLKPDTEPLLVMINLELSVLWENELKGSKRLWQKKRKLKNGRSLRQRS